jgi:hypothetical protein
MWNKMPKNGREGLAVDLLCRLLIIDNDGVTLILYSPGIRQAVHRQQAKVLVIPDYRVHRIAAAAFWRTFLHQGKISPGW